VSYGDSLPVGGKAVLAGRRSWAVSKELVVKVRRLRWMYALCSSTSLALGLWMVIAPTSFWGLIDVNDTDPIVQTIYGGAICGEGIICLLGLSKPLQYVAIFQYMMAYKVVVCIALIARLAFMSDAPIAGWFIVVAWGSVAVQAAIVYPWGMRSEVVEALKEE
jgi:hypothetical protein